MDDRQLLSIFLGSKLGTYAASHNKMTHESIKENLHPDI